MLVSMYRTAKGEDHCSCMHRPSEVIERTTAERYSVSIPNVYNTVPLNVHLS